MDIRKRVMTVMQIGFFSEENRLEKLSKLGDSLVRLNTVINWEQFRPILKTATKKEHKGLGERPPYDLILMLKILILQRLYNLSDDQMEYQVNGRISFMRFLGLGLGDIQYRADKSCLQSLSVRNFKAR